MKEITANVNGKIYSAHMRLVLCDEDYEKFKSLPVEEQTDWLKSDAELILDDLGDNELLENAIIKNIKIKEI